MHTNRNIGLPYKHLVKPQTFAHFFKKIFADNLEAVLNFSRKFFLA